MAELPGWAHEDHAAAFRLVRQDCRDTATPPPVCDEAARVGPLDEGQSRRFLEARFRAESIAGAGVLTAYFTPTYEARPRPDATFSAPLRPPPDGPAAGLDRAQLDALPAPDALAWMRPEDLFFLQIQGSGDLVFPDGQRKRAVFAGSNGRPFVAIAGPMAAEGLIQPREASASAVHAWLAAHRGPEAEAAMRRDPRYIFFHLTNDAGAAPRGASGAPLIAGRSLAIDPARHPYFELLWIDAEQPALAGARPAYRRLVAALDAGEAATVRHRLELYRIIPRETLR
jgi:membrane-bound lytic murein transglycosylase A